VRARDDASSPFGIRGQLSLVDLGDGSSEASGDGSLAAAADASGACAWCGGRCRRGLCRAGVGARTRGRVRSAAGRSVALAGAQVGGGARTGADAVRVRRSALSGAGRLLRGGPGGRPLRADRAPGGGVPGRVGALDRGRHAAAGAGALPGRGAGVLVASRGAAGAESPGVVGVGAVDRLRRPRAAHRRAADGDRRAGRPRPAPGVPGRVGGDEAAGVRRPAVRATRRVPG
jgi:hypothetical protein